MAFSTVADPGPSDIQPWVRQILRCPATGGELVDAADALARTASSVYDMLRLTHEADSQELKLVEAQDYYANPQLQFNVEAL